jgi:hypothetical protein
VMMSGMCAANTETKITIPEETRTPESSPIALTVGHAGCTVDEFILPLQAHGVALVVGVRLVPRSRYHPRFNKTRS